MSTETTVRLKVQARNLSIRHADAGFVLLHAPVKICPIDLSGVFFFLILLFLTACDDTPHWVEGVPPKTVNPDHYFAFLVDTALVPRTRPDALAHPAGHFDGNDFGASLAVSAIEGGFVRVKLPTNGGEAKTAWLQAEPHRLLTNLGSGRRSIQAARFSVRGNGGSAYEGYFIVWLARATAKIKELAGNSDAASVETANTETSPTAGRWRRVVPLISGAPLYPSPSLKGPPIGQLSASIPQASFVFAQTSDAVLLGYSNLAVARFPKSGLLGWTARNAVAEWNTGLGFGVFSKRPDDNGTVLPIMAFASQDDLSGYLDDDSRQGQIEPVFTEFPDLSHPKGDIIPILKINGSWRGRNCFEGVFPARHNTSNGLSVGYFCARNRNGRSVGEMLLLLPKTKLFELYAGARNLWDILLNPESSLSELAGPAAGIIKALTGEFPGNDEPIADFLQRVGGYRSQNPVLELSLADIDGNAQMLQDWPERDDAIFALSRSMMYLDGLLSERIPTEVHWNKQDGVHEFSWKRDGSGSVIRRHWFFDLGRARDNNVDRRLPSSPHAWVPVAFLP